MAIVALSSMLAPLNSTMIALALPPIMSEFETTMASAGWLVIGYLVAMASLQPVTGRLGDRLDRRRMILAGLAVFAVASLGAGLAPGQGVLIGFRVLQALALAMVVPNGVALLRQVVPAQRRGLRFGLVGSATSLAAASGPPLAGLMIWLAGWRFLFGMNALLIVPALWLGWRFIPREARAREESAFDTLGAVLLATVLGGLAVLLSSERAPGAPVTVLAAGLLLVLGAVWLRHELRHGAPVVQPRLFRRRAFTAAAATVAASNLAMYVTLLSAPLLLAQTAGWSSAQVGGAMAALSGTVFVVAPVGGRLADRMGRRRPAVAGLALFSAALLPLALTGGLLATPLLLASLAGAGAGLGLAMASVRTSAVEAVGAAEAGTAAGLYSTSRYFGSIVGSSLMAALMPSQGSEFGAVFVMVAVSALLAVAAALGLKAWPAAEEQTPAKP